MAAFAFSPMSAAEPAPPDDTRGAFGEGDDGAHDRDLFAELLQISLHLCRPALRRDDDHAGAAVEGPKELGQFNSPGVLEPAEHGRKGEGGQIDLDAQLHRKHARYVLDEAAARDMGERLDGSLALEQLEERLDVDPGRRKKRFPQRFAGREGCRRPIVRTTSLHDLADQRIAIGMGARGSKCQEHIPRNHVGARQDRLALDRANRETGEIIVAAVIKPRHLGRLPADQRASSLPAPLGNAGDHGASRREVELVAGEIVEEEERLRSLHDEIVDRHGDEIDSDRAMHSGLDGDLDLGANPVIGCDQHRIAEAASFEVEESAEAAKRAVRARSGRGAGQRLDRFDERIARGDIDASLPVGQALCLILFGIRHVASLLRRSRPSDRLADPCKRITVVDVGPRALPAHVNNGETCGVQIRLNPTLGAARLALVFLLLTASGAMAAMRDSMLYTVSNVDVDVTAKDASTAKLKAISEAQVKAFRILAERLGGPDAAAAVSYIDDAEIGRMMASLSIQSEKSGPGRYIGKLSVAFLPDKVRAALQSLGIAYSEERSPRIVVLPVWNGPEGPVAWEDNPWRTAWLSLNSDNDLVPIIVPLGDLDDSQTISAEEALRGDEVKLQSLKLRYEAETVLVAVAEPEGETAIHAIMSGESPLGVITFDKVYDGGEGGWERAAQTAAQRFVALMNEKWKSDAAALPSEEPVLPVQTVAIAVPFSSVGQWNSIRARLLSVQGVSGIDVTTIGSGGARIRLSFNTGIDQLQQSLALVGMKLVDRKGTLVLQPL